ncbi:MAG: hypothetical protein GY870_17460 [archaeon]|nr:hypothetical protein [archaeon]
MSVFSPKDWFYSYRELDDIVDEAKIEKMLQKISQQYAVLTKNWSEELNSQWTCRIYISTKMILNATVLLNSLEFSKGVNLRVVNSYIEYYSILSLLRCIIFTIPTADWDDGKILSITHSKTINVACDWISKFNPDFSEKIKDVTLMLKAQRELVSYRCPASGDQNLIENFDLDYHLTILAEIAQINSELLEKSVNKHTDKSMHIVFQKHIDEITKVEINGFSFNDSEDRYRLDYVRRKQPHPFNLALFMTEGQTEDFIGAWESESSEDDPDQFSMGSPSEWQQIFDIP